MKTIPLRSLWITLASCLLTQLDTSADLITGVTINSVSSELANFLRLAPYVVDGSGLTGNVHSTQPNFAMWLNTGNGWYGGVADPTNPGGVGAVITFDLGQTYDLTSMHIWNYNEWYDSWNHHLRRGAKDVAVSTSASVGGGFTDVGPYVFAQATGPNDSGESHILSASLVRLIRFNISSNYWPVQGSDAALVGLAEVQFFGNQSAASAVPEPSVSFALGALALVGWRRRRRVQR